jgi:DNA-binding CsgD family transcriptional regulator
VQACSDHAHPWPRALAAEDASAVLATDDQPASALDMLESAIALHEQAGTEQDAERARRRRWKIQAQGVTNAQVAERLSLSRHSVDFDLRQIFRKLGVSTRVEVARLAIEHEASWRDE